MDQGGFGISTLRCIVYCSTQTEPMDSAALEALASHAARRNAGQDITGQLIFLKPHFIQLLEGPAGAVEELFSAIQRDRRHHALRLLLRRDVATRAFPGWAMALTGDAGEDAWRDGAPSIQPALGIDFVELEDLLNQPVPEGATSLRRPVQQDRARGTVERIFQTARRTWMRGGPGALTVPALVEQAAVTEPTFYRYFSGMDDLLRAGTLRGAMRRLEEWKTVLDTTDFTSDAHLADVLADLGSRNFMRLGRAPASLAASLLPHVSALTPQLARILAPRVVAAMRRCDLAGAGGIDEQGMAALLAAMLGGAISLAGDNAARLRGEQTRRTAAAMFLTGLRTMVQTRDA